MAECGGGVTPQEELANVYWRSHYCSQVILCTLYCIVLYSVVQCSNLQYTAVQCSTVQSVQYFTVQCSTVQCSAVLYSQCSIVQGGDIGSSGGQPHQHSVDHTQLPSYTAALQCTALHCTALHCTTQQDDNVQNYLIPWP